jgi:hypothetical protein
MNKNIILAALVSIFGVAALLTVFRLPIAPEAVIGWITVLVLVAMATMEYRINWRRIFDRR